MAWAILSQSAWASSEAVANLHAELRTILEKLRPEKQPRWQKGMASLLSAHVFVSIGEETEEQSKVHTLHAGMDPGSFRDRGRYTGRSA